MYQGIDNTVTRSPYNFTRARATWVLLSFAVIYVQLAIFLPNGWLAEVMRCVQITLSFIVLLGYWRPATTCFFVVGRWPEKHNVIALGIEVSWFSIFCNSGWALFYRLSGQQSWMINNDFYTAWTATSAFAATMHIFAPNMFGTGLPSLDKRRFGAAGIFGLILVLIVGFWRPDLTWLANWMHDYISEPDWLLRGLFSRLTYPLELIGLSPSR